MLCKWYGFVYIETGNVAETERVLGTVLVLTKREKRLFCSVDFSGLCVVYIKL